jgi:hypothetical protein
VGDRFFLPIMTDEEESAGWRCGHTDFGLIETLKLLTIDIDSNLQKNLYILFDNR